MLRKTLLILLICLMLVIPVHAQSLTETYTAESGLRFRYPTGAEIYDYGDGTYQMDYTTANGGYIYITLYEETLANLGLSSADALATLQAQFTDAYPDLTLSNAGGKAVLVADDGFSILIMVVVNEALITLLGYGDDNAAVKNLALQMVGSVSYGAGGGNIVIAPTTPAQSEPGAFTSRIGLSMVLPEGWTVEDSGFFLKVSYLAGNSPITLEMSITSAKALDVPPGGDVMAAEKLALGADLELFTETTIGEIPALKRETEAGGHWIVEVSEKGIVNILIYGSVPYHASTIDSLIATMVFTLDLADDTGVMWQTQRRTGEEGNTFAFFNDMELGTDGLLYIAGGNVGVHVFEPEAGEFLKTIQNEAITSLSDLALDPDGSIWIVDGIARQVYHLSQEGEILAQWGDIGAAEGQFQQPTQIERDAEGRLFVFDTNTNEDGYLYGQVQVFEPDGAFLYRFPTRINVYEKLETLRGAGVKMEIAPNGNLYLLNRFDPLRVFDLAGNVVEAALIDRFGNSTVTAFTVGTDGQVYVAAAEGWVSRLPGYNSRRNTLGRKQAKLTGGGFSSDFDEGEIFAPQGIVLLPNGDVIIADSNLGFSQLVRFNFAG